MRMSANGLVGMLGLTVALALSSCGKKKESSSSASFGKGTLQGVVRNALTGERIAVESGNKNMGVYAIVKNKIIPAKSHLSLAAASEADADQTLIGEYYMTGLPLDVEFPVIVNIEGYELFEGVAKVNKTRKQRTESSQERDDEIAHPIIIADLDIVPTGTSTQDVEVLVQDDRKTPIAGALVRVELKNQIGTKQGNTNTEPGYSNGYFTLGGSRERVIFGQTDDTGKMKIEGSKLALGQNYSVEVTPPNTVQDQDDEVDQTFKVAYRAKEFSLEDLEEGKTVTNVVKVVINTRVPAAF